MHFPSLSILALVATVTYAQTIQEEVAKIPMCGMTCLSTAAATAGCGATDFTCQCGAQREAISRSAIPCVVKACQSSDLATITKASGEICRLNALAGMSGSGTSTSASGSATGIAGIINTSIVSSAASMSGSMTMGTATSTVKIGTQTASAASASATKNVGSVMMLNIGAGVVGLGAVVGAFAL